MFKLFVGIMISLNTELATSNSLRKVIRNLNRKQQITLVVIEKGDSDGR